MAYLLAISFLLHFLSFFIIVILFQKINATSSSNQNKLDQEKVKKEIEDLLVAYTAEMKEENEKLLQKLVSKRTERGQNQAKTATMYEKAKASMDYVNEVKQVKEVYKEEDKDNVIIPPFVNDSRFEATYVKQTKSPMNYGKKVKQTEEILKEVDNEEVYSPPVVYDTEDVIEQSSTAQILSLAKQGYSAKDIAKKLNIGDGEVELFLKFHK